MASRRSEVLAASGLSDDDLHESDEDVERAPCLGPDASPSGSGTRRSHSEDFAAPALPAHRALLYRVPALGMLAVVALANVPRQPPHWLVAGLGFQQEDQERSLLQGKAEEDLRLPKFRRLNQGTCYSRGLFPITDASLCEAAAQELGLVVAGGMKAVSDFDGNRPQGCFWYSAAATAKAGPVEELRFSVGDTHGRGAETSDLQIQQLHKPICTSNIECGLFREDTQWVGDEIVAVDNIPTAGICCQKCQADFRCWAWSLDTSTKKCSLLEHTTDFSPPVGKNRTGFISGLPVRERTVSPLYCVALMQPNSYETALLQMQKNLRVSMFACDEYNVYSNAAIEILPGLTTAIIESDLKCGMGGDAGTALNTGIFIAFWKKVIEDGRFRFNQWVVKVDPDAVFFPDRLRGLVQSIPDGERGVYLNNCKYGLHGPIEVFSRTALEYYGKEYHRCEQKLWFAYDHWGEDMYIDQCMDKVLKIRRDDIFSLICEDHCDCPEYKACNNAAVVFHPFKTEDDYRQCMLSAGAVLPM